MIEAARYEAEHEEAVTGTGIALAFVRSVLWAAVVTTLGTLGGYLVGIGITGWHGLLYLGGLFLGLLVSQRMVRDEDFQPVHLVAAGGLHVLILGVGMVISAQIYDFTVEGTTEDYTSVYLLREGWNPLASGEVELPVKGARGPFADEPVYRSEGVGWSSAALMSAVLAEVYGGTDAGKGWYWLCAVTGGVMISTIFLRLRVATFFSICAGLGTILGSSFASTWNDFGSGGFWYLLGPVLITGLLGEEDRGYAEWSDLLLLVAIPGLFAGGEVAWVAGLALLLSLVVGGNRRLPGAPRSFVRLFAIPLCVLSLLVGVVGGGPGVSGFVDLGDALFGLGPGGGWLGLVEPAFTLRVDGVNGPIFVVSLGVAILLFVRRFLLGLDASRINLWVMLWIFCAIGSVATVEATSILLLGLGIVLLFDTFRDPSAEELSPGLYRLGIPRFINLGRSGGTARWMGAVVCVLWMVQGVVIFTWSAIEARRAQVEVRSLFFESRFRTGIVKASFGESVAAYEWLTRDGVRFELVRNPVEDAVRIPYTDITLFSLTEEEAMWREVGR